MDQKKLKVRLARMNENTEREFTNIVSSVEGCSIFVTGDTGVADVLIMNVGESLEEEISLVYQAVTTNVAKNIFLTSRQVKPEFLIEAMRAGVKEFFSQPIKLDEVKRALQKLLEQQPGQTSSSSLPKKNGSIFNVIGSKGGIGTTTVAVNIASSLQNIAPDKTVALIDMNMLFGEIPMFLGIQPSFDWVEVAKNVYRLDSTYLFSVMAKHSSGLHILPSPIKVEDGFKITPAIINTLLVQMKGMFDYIIIDGGLIIDDVFKAIARLSDKLIIVTLLSLPCLINVKRILDTFRVYGFPPEERVMILVNRNQKRSVISIDDAEKTLKKQITFTIPNDFQNTMSAINQGIPLNILQPVAEITESFTDVSRSLVGENVKKKGLLSWR
jgi:pilus assembly protein CpaE